MKNYFFFVLILLSLNFTSSLAKGAVEYSEAADVFEIMDNVSRWHPSTRKEYKNHWEKTFGALGNNQNWLDDYSKIRKAFYPKNKMRDQNDMFGNSSLNQNFFSEAFYSSKSVGQALKKLTKNLKKEEIIFLKKFYKHFLPQIQTMVKESTSFKQKTIYLSNQWKKSKVPKTIKNLAKHLNMKVSSSRSIKVLPVWWPKNESPTVEIRGNYLIIRYHPLEQAANWDITEILPQAINAFLIAQPRNQRENLTTIFNTRCNGRGIDFVEAYKLLWSKVLIEKQKNKKEFDLYQFWSRKPFINLYIKLLFPLLENDLKQKGTIGGQFIHKAASLCREVHMMNRR